MYKTHAETRAFFDAFKPLSPGATHCDIIVAPPFTSLTAAVEAARGTDICIAAQTWIGNARVRSPAKFPHA